MGLFSLFGNKNLKKYNKLKELSKDDAVLEGIQLSLQFGMTVGIDILFEVATAIELINEISNATNIPGHYILSALSDEDVERDLLSKIS